MGRRRTGAGVRALKLGTVLLTSSLAMSVTTASLAAPVDLKALPLQSPFTTLEASKRPLALGVDEKIAGLHVGNNRRAKRTIDAGTWPAVAVFDDAVKAERYAMEGTFVANVFPENVDTCFTVQLSPDGADVVSDLENNSSSSASLFAEVPEISGYPRVALVRAERFVDGKDARLELTDFWVDSQTGGLRVIRHLELGLTQVGESEMGLIAYAARTGEERFEVVVEQQQRPAERELYASLRESEKMALMNVQANSSLTAVIGNTFLTSACGHLRFRLELAQPPPSVAPGPNEVGFVPQGQLRRESAVVSSMALLAWEYEEEPKDARQDDARLNRVRTRPVSINFGLSRLSRDAAPVFSMSYRWTGPETTQFMGPMRPQSVPLL